MLPLAGVAESHDPPDVVATAVVKLKAVPLLATVMDLAAGVVPPIVYAKLKDVGDAESVGVLVVPEPAAKVYIAV